MRRTWLAPLGALVLLAGCFEDPTPSETGNDEAGDMDADTGTSEDGETGTSESTSEDTGTETDTTTDTDTGTDTTSSDSTDTSTDAPAPECGNGVVEGDEVCDDGPAPELAPGACVPDCSAVIETKTVVRGGNADNGYFGNNPVAFADSKCEPGYKAMFAYGNGRVATTTAWESVGSVDWPVQPWTAYETMEGELVWVTDDVALIGVRAGAHEDVLANMGSGGCFGNPPICFFYNMITGMEVDGTTLLSNTCNGWTSSNDTYQGNYGSFSTGEYNTGTTGCSFGDLFVTSASFLCVEL